MEDKKNELHDEIIEENQEEVVEEINVDEVVNEESTVEQTESEEDNLSMLRKLKDNNKRKDNEIEALKERLLRLTAEYENYRKRTAKEKDGIYSDACVDVLKEIVPVIDNIERAIASEGSVEDLKKGVEMTLKVFQGAIEKLGVEEIDASGEFDPNIHQAVMHIEDENLGKNQVAEVFLKGYKKGDKVIRYTVVKVAN